MEKRYITIPDVERSLLVYERHFGMSSAELYDAHYADDGRVAHIPRRHRARWASLYRTLRRMSGGTLAERIERELEPA